MADLLSIPTGDRYPPLNLTPQKRKEKTLQALLAQLEGLAARQPVLMVFEDVHWSDPTTRESLDLIVDRVATLRVLVIVTFRPEFTPPWVGRPQVTLLSLSRLPRRQRAEMITRVTGGKALPKEIADQIIDRTDGVPLFIATDQWRAGGPKGLEPIAVRTRTQDTPDVHRIVNSCDRQSAEITIVKQAAQQAARIVCYHNRVRFGGPLQPCRKISRLTNDRLLLGRALTEEIADHDEARRDADTHLQRGRLARIELGHGLDQGEARAHRLFGVLLMRLRVTEIGQYAVAEILRDKAAGAGDYLGATAVIAAHDVVQLLRIEPRRQCCGTDEIGEHDRELATFAFLSFAAEAIGLDRTFSRVARRFSSQRGNRNEERTPMADRRHAEFTEILGRQLGQDYLVYRVFPECLHVAFQAEAAQPGRNIHGVHTHTWPHSSAGDRRRQLREPVGCRQRSSRLPE